MTEYVFAFMVAFITTIGSWAVGSLCLRSKFEFSHPALHFSFKSALGLLILSSFIFLLSCTQLISTNHLRVFLLVLTLFSLLGFRRFFHLSKNEKKHRASHSLIWLFLGISVLAYALFICACVLLPPAARDELLYHLEVPRQILKHGGFFRELDNIYFYYPQLGEMLFLFAMANGGEVTARLIHVLFGFLIASALYGFSRQYLSRLKSIIVVTVFLTTPAVMVTMPLAYVDLIYTLFAFLALAALLSSFSSGRLSWIVLSALMAGGALCTKYTGISLIFVFLCLILIESLWLRNGRIAGRGLIFSLIAFSAFIPYILRNWALTGWPLFPFHVGPFPLQEGINWDPERARLLVGYLASFGIPIGADSLWHHLFSPVLIFLQGRFNDPRFYEGILGPIFLLAPLALIKRQPEKTIKILGLFCVLFLFAWVSTTKQARFLFPVLPVLSFLVVLGIDKWNKRTGYFILCGLMIFNAAMGIREIWKQDPLPFWLKRESRDQFLSRQLPSYPIFQVANRDIGPADGVYLINAKNYVYYLNVPWRADFVFERLSLDRYLKGIDRPEQVGAFFKQRRCNYFLIDEIYAQSPSWGFESREGELFWSFVRSRSVLLAKSGSGLALYKIIS